MSQPIGYRFGKLILLIACLSVVFSTESAPAQASPDSALRSFSANYVVPASFGLVGNTSFNSNTSRPIEEDKLVHFGASFLLTMHIRFPLERTLSVDRRKAIWVAASTAISAGLMKELFDSRRRNGTGFDWLDFAFDAIGVSMATLLSLFSP